MVAASFIRPVVSFASLVGAGLCLWLVSWSDADQNAVPPLDEPWQLSFTDFRVVIDAGHGGQDGGTQGFGALEKDISLKLALLVKKHLDATGIPVLLTRDADVFLELGARSEFANRNRADVFLSIHLNADATSADTAGVEIYHSSRKRLGDNAALKRELALPPEIQVKDSRSEMLAGIIQKRVCAALGSTNRGVRDSSFLVVTETSCAAVLLECGYLTNEQESQKLQSPPMQERLASAAADGIRHYLTAITMNPVRGLLFTQGIEAAPALEGPPVLESPPSPVLPAP